MKLSYREISCPRCQSTHIVRSGRTKEGEQRYRCQEKDCETKTFKLSYRYKACKVGIKEKIIEMAINGSGVRDTGRVLQINKNTVIKTLKKRVPLSPKSIRV
jgi:transposase-like protein